MGNFSIRLTLVAAVLCLGAAGREGLAQSAHTPSAPSFDFSLSPVPPMGWNSWNRFRCDLNEALIRETADAMVKNGMRDMGYEYVILDDCWQGGRRADGELVADPEKFPSGIAALAKYVHAKGLKLGIYSDAGTATCQGRPGSRGYEFQDARTFARWRVDYLKYDWCNTGQQNPQESYKIMRNALIASGRPIVFSMSEWGVSEPWTWARGVSHLWRISQDIRACWNCTGEHVQSVLSIMDLYAAKRMFTVSAPGGWNNLDMLEVGNPGLTIAEARAHFSLWTIATSPLIAGNDLRSLDPEILAILTSPEVIAVNQDPAGRGGVLYRRFAETEIWQKDLTPAKDGQSRTAFLLLNRSDAPVRIPLYVEGVKIIRDLWRRKTVPIRDGLFDPMVPVHDVVMVLVTGGLVPK